MNAHERSEVERLLASDQRAPEVAAEVDRYMVVLAEAKGEVVTEADESSRLITELLGADRVKTVKPAQVSDQMPAGARF